MDYLLQHKNILEDAAKHKIPEYINPFSESSVEVVRELIEEGYLKAIDASDSVGLEYLEPRIALSGREYLNNCSNGLLKGPPKGRSAGLVSDCLIGREA